MWQSSQIRKSNHQNQHSIQSIHECILSAPAETFYANVGQTGTYTAKYRTDCRPLQFPGDRYSMPIHTPHCFHPPGIPSFYADWVARENNMTVPG